MSGRLLHVTLRALDAVARVLPWAKDGNTPPHLRTARRGERDAYFYLRRCGYVMVARNWRSPHHRGELDLVGWDGVTLCFIEVKTRTTRDVKPAEAAVDADKQNDLSRVARDYLRRLAGRGQQHDPPFRFDIVSVYYDGSRPQFELFQNAFSASRR